MFKHPDVKLIPAQPGWSLVLEPFDDWDEIQKVVEPSKVDIIAWALEVLPDDRHKGPEFLRDWKVETVAVTAAGGERRFDCQVLCDPNNLFYGPDSGCGLPWPEFVETFLKPWRKT